ncbi:MAG TPA: TIGR03435 family protein [Bryobacteraceae bacterium]|nr:TIGR03435 family protein [Bryobacteraceae bacterium]
MRTATVAFLAILCLPALPAQQSGGKMAFEVASIKLSRGELVDLPFWDEYSPTNGRFQAEATLAEFIEFAYNLWSNEAQRHELSRLPKWASDDRYRIEARAPIGNPTKDQMFLMVQSLLAERFQLAARFEERELPVFEVRLARPGKLGPNMPLHANGPPCDRPGVPARPGLPGFICHSFFALDLPGAKILGSRDVTMGVVIRMFSELPRELGRAIIDKTGLTGRYDVTIEWAPEPKPSATPDTPPPAPAGPAFVDAVRESARPQAGVVQSVVARPRNRQGGTAVGKLSYHSCSASSGTPIASA